MLLWRKRSPFTVFEVSLVKKVVLVKTLDIGCHGGHFPGNHVDLFQETMVVAWRRLDDFDHTRPFGPWLRGLPSSRSKPTAAYVTNFQVSFSVCCFPYEEKYSMRRFVTMIAFACFAMPVAAGEAGSKETDQKSLASGN